MGSAYSWLAVQGKSAEETLKGLGLERGEPFEGFPNGSLSGIALPSGWYLVVSDRCDYAYSRWLSRLSRQCDLVTCAVEEHALYATASGWHNGRRTWEITHDSQEREGKHHLVVLGTPPEMFDTIRRTFTAEQASFDEKNQPVDCIMEIPIETARQITGFSFHQPLPEGNAVCFQHLHRDRKAKQWWQVWRR